MKIKNKKPVKATPKRTSKWKTVLSFRDMPGGGIPIDKLIEAIKKVK